MLDFQLLEIFSLLIFFIGINLILNGIAGKFDNNSSWLTIFPVSTFLFPVSLCVLSTSFFPRCQYLVPLTKSLNYHQYFPFSFSWSPCNSRQFLWEYYFNWSTLVRLLFFSVKISIVSSSCFIFSFSFFFSLSCSSNVFEKNSSNWWIQSVIQYLIW